MQIGLIAMSAKPFHAGHYSLIQQAAEKNDRVLVFVSLSDRARKGEPTVKGEDMRKIWQQHLLKIMPSNVSVSFDGVPIRKIYEVLGAANTAGASDTYAVYSDPDDIAKNYPIKSRQKYFGDLYAKGNVRFEPISRKGGVDVSGTQMRTYLASGDKTSFINNLPKSIDGDAVWNILTQKTVGEQLLRLFVRRSIA